MYPFKRKAVIGELTPGNRRHESLWMLVKSKWDVFRINNLWKIMRIMTLSYLQMLYSRIWIGLLFKEVFIIASVIFLLVTVKLLWNIIYCIKHYLNISETNWFLLLKKNKQKRYNFLELLNIPREAFPTNRADIRLVHAAVVRAHMVGHAVLPLETLVTNGALVGLLVRVWELVAVEVVDVTEGLAAHLAAVVLLHRFGGFLGYGWLLLRQDRHHARSRRCGSGGGGEDASHRGDVGRVAVVVPWHSGNERHHGGRCGCLLGPWHHLNACVTGLMPPEVVTVPKGLVAVAAYEGSLWLGFLLYYYLTTTASATSSPSARPTAHVVFEEVSRTDWGFLVEQDGKNRLLILRLSVEQRQQAVLVLVLVVEGFIGLLR